MCYYDYAKNYTEGVVHSGVRLLLYWDRVMMAERYSIDELIELIKQGRTHEFYNSWEWRKLAHDVMKEQHNECQLCKARGKYKRARIVHHVKHLKQYPGLAYSRTYTDIDGQEKRQLIALCQDCHEAEHPERFRFKRKKPRFENDEHWE